MSYRVVITANAKANLRSYYRRAAESAPVTASRWLDRFEEALQTLAQNARRCPLAPEDELVDAEVRQLLFGRGRNVYRALFTISGDDIQVLHVRRGARDTATPDELVGCDDERGRTDEP